MLKTYIKRLAAGQDLTPAEMQVAIGGIVDGQASDAQVAAFLTALGLKGETAAEIQGAALGVAHRMLPFPGPTTPNAIDTCGTGGDASNTFNISTAAALLAAAGGAQVIKHGNRAVSSVCGSADVLAALGVAVRMTPAEAQQSLTTTNFCFCFAPDYHPAMRQVAPVRQEMGLRTVFNLVGPLVNPAPLGGQVVGVYQQALLPTMGAVLQGLGRRRALVVHGAGGVDEITLSGVTAAVCVDHATQTPLTLSPETFGLASCPREELQGGTPEENAAIIEEIFAGATGGRRDTVVANAAAALYVAGLAADLAQGARQAEAAIDSGRARQTLAALRQLAAKGAGQ